MSDKEDEEEYSQISVKRSDVLREGKVT